MTSGAPLFRRLLPLLALLATLAAGQPPAAASEALPATAISISDIHFNPFYDATLTTRLAAAPASGWPAIFATSSDHSLGGYDSVETNYNLLAATFGDLGRQRREADFLLFTGDILAHHFEDRYQDAKLPPEGRREFTAKTVAVLTEGLRKAAGGRPVYFVLGNNDSYCGDYKIAPEGPFLHDTAELFYRAYLQGTVEHDAFVASYTKGGYYHARVPGLPDARIVALNTIFFSAKYDNACGAKLDYDPGDAQLQWLEETLAAAEAVGERVWLLLHIPPGIDVFDTLQYGTTATFWKPAYHQRLLTLLRRHAESIRAAFAGHTHMDDFRLIPAAAGGQPLSFVHISPGVSPQFGNNPGYETLHYRRDDFSLADFQVRYLDLTAQPQPGWAPEYGFDRLYGIEQNDARGLSRAHQRIRELPAVRAAWMKYYNLSHTADPAIDEGNWQAYWCGIGEQTPAEFEACYPQPAAAQ